MPAGTGLTNFNKDLSASPPTNGKGINVGALLYQQLVGRISDQDYQLVGLPDIWKLSTLDLKFPIKENPNMQTEEYRF